MTQKPDMIEGFVVHRSLLDAGACMEIIEAARGVARVAPFISPVTPGGRKMSVRMTSAGRCGWISDGRGYRYADRHPSGVAWPPIPEPVLGVWKQLVGGARQPDCCLFNYYASDARMGLHRDADEGDFSWPVVSISLGDSARFRIGGLERRDPTTSLLLESGDVVVLGGPARLAYHGIDRIRFGSSRLLPSGGRLNITLRVVA